MMPDKARIDEAVAVLRAGGLVGLPTETVYGLAADASQPAAVARIFAAKGRPASNPLIVHVASVEALTQWAVDIPPAALALAKVFWPGPLTLVLKKQPWVLDVVTAGQPTVALRVPAHPVALAVLNAFGGGLAAPSANQSTHVSPTTAKGVAQELAGRVDLILEGGACEVGVESTILDLSGEVPRVLRPGMITQAAIEAVLGVPVAVAGPDSSVVVPGQHLVHYAPLTPLQLVSFQSLPVVTPEDLPIAYLTHHRDVVTPAGVSVVFISDNPVIYAQRLYQQLREWDETGFKCIWVDTVPDGLGWEAIKDRLNKAAGRSLLSKGRQA